MPIDSGLTGSPRIILEQFSRYSAEKQLRPKIDNDWGKTLLSTISSHRHRLRERLTLNDDRLFPMVHTIDRLSAVLTSDDMVIFDGPTVTRVAMVHLKHPGLHNCVLLNDADVAGAGYPLALGARLAKPGARVFLISETEMLKRHHREFQTQSRYQLGVTTFLFQTREQRPEEEVDFAVLARSLGVPAKKIVDAEEEITDTLLSETSSSPTGGLLDIVG